MCRRKPQNLILEKNMKNNNRKQKVRNFYLNKNNWTLIPPSLSLIGKKVGVSKTLAHRYVTELKNEKTN